jgi:threonylcarbamoyladenosine tRNA methylthiotransferase MtaB
MNVYLESIGCKLNQSEIEQMARRLHHAGHRVVYDPVEADICLFNSCAVTQTAARKTRQALRRLARQNPQAEVVAMGCYVELWPDQIREIEGVRLLAGPDAKAHVLHALGLPIDAPTGEPLARRRTRAFVKVQDGCDNHCTYCVVRIARGRERSRPLDDILTEIAHLAGEGVQEIVLTGVHVGAYGHDRGSDLVDLVRAILDLGGVRRLRLSSIEPWHLQPVFLDLWQDERLCRHLHLPLQSGCDATLRRMGRRYATGEFARVVEQARARIPDLAITTDVMVGFPGETDEEFAASLRFVEQIGFSRLHVFRYSRRPGTPAASFPDQTPAAVSGRRSDQMQKVGNWLSRRFREGMLGRTLPVLWETRDGAAGRWSGLTDNYVRVVMESNADRHNQIDMVRLMRLEGDDAMYGELER